MRFRTLPPLLLLAVASAITLFPLWWMFVVSLETPANAGAAIVGGGDVLKLWPEVPQWGNYAEAIEEMGRASCRERV